MDSNWNNISCVDVKRQDENQDENLNIIDEKIIEEINRENENNNENDKINISEMEKSVKKLREKCDFLSKMKNMVKRNSNNKFICGFKRIFVNKGFLYIGVYGFFIVSMFLFCVYIIKLNYKILEKINSSYLLLSSICNMQVYYHK